MAAGDTQAVPDAVFGFDIGGTSVKWLLLDVGGTVVEDGVFATPAHGGAEAVVQALTAVIEQRRGLAAAVGIGVPGHVDRDTGVVRFVPNLPGHWTGFRLADAVAGSCGLPAYVLNDARAFGLAEFRLGAARGFDTVVFVTLGTGVGGALGLDGQLLVGAQDRAGEIGHQTYDPAGPVCGCGNSGCLEMYAAGPALVAAARKRAVDGSWVVRDAENRPEEITVELLGGLAAEGDPIARGIFVCAGRALGVVLSSTCALLGAHAVVIGGGVAGAFEHFSSAVEEALVARRQMLGEVQVRQARLGGRAGAVGAALWAAERVRRGDR